jgi:peptidoglycan/xylan/chitin deacetylase (PgdA/CDA1 family)
MLRSLWIKLPALALAAAAIGVFDGAAGFLVAAGILLAAAALLMAIVFDVNSSFWAKTLWSAPRPRDAVALTFDDGPDPAFTSEVLRVLAERKVPAAFFVVGARVREHPELIERLDAEGHLVCNHTDTHSMTFHFQLWKTCRRELLACSAAIESVIGKRPALFRSPQGAKNPALGDVLGELGLTAVGWQVRGFDSVTGDARKIEERIMRRVRPGGVILLHDGAGLGGSSDRSATLAALPRIIDRIRERGLTFVRLDELLEVAPYCEATAS